MVEQEKILKSYGEFEGFVVRADRRHYVIGVNIPGWEAHYTLPKMFFADSLDEHDHIKCQVVQDGDEIRPNVIKIPTPKEVSAESNSSPDESQNRKALEKFKKLYKKCSVGKNMHYYHIDCCVDYSSEKLGGIYGALCTLMKGKKSTISPYKGKKVPELLENMCYDMKKPFEQRLPIKNALIRLGCPKKHLDLLLQNCSNNLYLVNDTDLWASQPSYGIHTMAPSPEGAIRKLRKGKTNLEKCFGVKINNLKDAWPAIIDHWDD